ncbi:DoxX family membrane protein [Paracoccus sp. SCSIO 75233]|uniref:DoxX family membrane protein n=1 Tax=Paracoccus sp. SCSIO 75233 TaxID=3017782 RepID=UPI0022EFE09B|nr:DoxX family membrane protein [Paracoccus sp. SCSIO 75233]WBU54143.1 DoxX family membrane protein [Paracoccus sp. SCSIO 75233]
MIEMLDRMTRNLDRLAPDLLPLMARLSFVAALGSFFWRAALTKLDGFGLSAGAYAQILPKLAEASGYDVQAMPLWADLVVAFGTVSELMLPALLLVGLLTRLSALSMMGFILVMSLTDIYGHGVPVAELSPRLMWLALLAVPFLMGGGWLALDRYLPLARLGRAVVRV